MEKFDTPEEALKAAMEVDPEVRELESGEDFWRLPAREAANIINVHATGGGMWTWCYQRDMAD